MYRCGANGTPVLVELDSPTDDEMHALLRTLITRLMKLLTRRGVLVEEMGQPHYLAEPDAEGDEAHTLWPLQAAAISYRIVYGPRAGQWVRHGISTSHEFRVGAGAALLASGRDQGQAQPGAANP